jgi:hypothetical protein
MLEIAVVRGVVQALPLLDPLVAGGHGVKAPMDEHPQAGFT